MLALTVYSSWRIVIDMSKTHPLSEFLSTEQAAAELDISVRRVQALLKKGRFVGAQKLGRDWTIPRSALAGMKDRKTGRPKATEPE
jgi:excisionase family DNA binding protein